MEKPRKIYQLHDLFEQADEVDVNLLWDTYSKDNFEIEYTPKNPEDKKLRWCIFPVTVCTGGEKQILMLA